MAELQADGILTENAELTAKLSKPISMVGALSLPVGYETYKGTYIFTPASEPQTIDTNDRLMIDDIVIAEIPYAAVKNVANGTTVTIA